jgi:hypothetical protein
MDHQTTFEKIYTNICDVLDTNNYMHAFSDAIYKTWKVSESILEQNLAEKLVIRWERWLCDEIDNDYRETKHSSHRLEYDEYKMRWICKKKAEYRDHVGLMDALDAVEKKNNT